MGIYLRNLSYMNIWRGGHRNPTDKLDQINAVSIVHLIKDKNRYRIHHFIGDVILTTI